MRYLPKVSSKIRFFIIRGRLVKIIIIKSKVPTNECRRYLERSTGLEKNIGRKRVAESTFIKICY